MTAILLNALFALGGLIAIIAIWTTLQRYAGPAMSSREALHACSDTREVRFSITEVAVRSRATVLRPDFTVRKVNPLPQASLPVAA